MRIRTLFKALIGIVALASCSGDQWTASRLDGAWEGDFGMYYEYRYNGHDYREYAANTYIEFNQMLFSDHGTGRQTDFYVHGPYAHMSYRFNWRVVNGDIIMTYPCDPQWNTVIHDYRLRFNHFYGYFGDSSNSFDLISLDRNKVSPYNYNDDFYFYQNSGYDYYPGYGNFYQGYGYYSPSYTRGDEAETDSVPYFRIGNRFDDEGRAAKLKQANP